MEKRPNDTRCLDAVHNEEYEDTKGIAERANFGAFDAP